MIERVMEEEGMHRWVQDEEADNCDLDFNDRRGRGEEAEERGGKESRATSGKNEYFIKLVRTWNRKRERE